MPPSSATGAFDGSPWQPPLVAQIGAVRLGVSLDVGDGALQQTRTVWTPCFRMISSGYAGANILDDIATNHDLEEVVEIADLTRADGPSPYGVIQTIPREDRIFGPGASLIMAAFAWPGKNSRFSNSERGAYYAAYAPRTAAREMAYQRQLELLYAASGPVVMDMSILYADLDATLVDIRAPRACPIGVYVDSDYSAGQHLADVVWKLGGAGIRYDSLRDVGVPSGRRGSASDEAPGDCIAALRPSVLSNCRVGRSFEFHWDGNAIRIIS